jgi:hypothetical protein
MGGLLCFTLGGPSEVEVLESGINAAEMYAILLPEIGESTLYLVELNKN